MKIQVQHKKYNGGYISTGNVVSGWQYSTYVRGWKQTECNGHICEEGHLQRFDLEGFYSRYLPSFLRAYVRDVAGGKDGIILYCIRHFNGDDVVIHGWIVTDDNYNLKRVFYNRWTQKSEEIMDKAIHAVTVDAQKSYKQFAQ